MALPVPPSSSEPIPNSPFYSPETYTIRGAYYSFIVGSGIQVSPTGVISATGGGGGGGVTSLAAGSGISVSSSTGAVTVSNTGVTQISAGSGINISGSTGTVTVSAINSGTVLSITAGTGLIGGTITSIGTIALGNTSVIPGTYTAPTLNINAQGQITSAANGSYLAGITGTAPINVTTGANPVVSVTDASTVACGVVQLNDSVSSSSSSLAATSLAVKTAFDVAVQAIPKACLTAKGDLVTATAAATPFALTVGTDGQVLTANSTCISGLAWTTPSAGSVTSVATGTGLTGGPITSTGTICLADTAVTAGSYTYSSITVDAQGRLTAASNGVSPIPCSAFTAKGGVLAGTGAGTYEELALSVTDGQVLTVDSTCTNGVKWATGATVPAATPICLGTVYGCTELVNYNTALGYNTLLSFTTGNLNAGLGYGSLTYNTTGNANVAVGSSSLIQNVSGCYNVALGTGSLFYNTVGNGNVAIGDLAGLLTTGSRNVTIGPSVNIAVPAGDCQLAIGYDDGVNWLQGCSDLAIQPGAGIIDCAGSCGTIGQVLSSDGANAIEWVNPGSVAEATPLCFGTVLGCTTLTSDTRNTALGECAGVSLSIGTSNVLLGTSAGCCVTTGCGNNLIGDQAGRGLTTGGANVFIGANAGYTVVSGCCNVAIGVALALPVPDGSCQLALGWKGAGTTMCYWLTGSSTKAIKPGAGIIDCANLCGTIGQVLSSTGGNAIEWVDAGGPAATPIALGTVFACTTCDVGNTSTAGNGMTALGNLAYECAADGASQSVVIGSCAGRTLGFGRTAGASNSNVFIGHNAGEAAITSSNNIFIGLGTAANNASIGSQNVVVGTLAGQLLDASAGCNTILGSRSGQSLTTGSSNVALGEQAGNFLTTGSRNVLIGPNVCAGITTESCNLAIGYSNTGLWLTGDSTKAIKPGAGIIDCAASCGTANQVLVSTGANAVQWKSVNSTIAAPNYGSFYDPNIQFIVTPNVPRPVRFLNVDIANNFSVVGTTQITAAVAGVYNVQFSLQLLVTPGGGGEYEVWPAIDGTPIPNSNTRFSVKNTNEAECASLNYIVALTAGQYIELYWATDNIDNVLYADTSLFGGPAIPSAIITVVPVGA
jgi:hypothetical protein